LLAPRHRAPTDVSVLGACRVRACARSQAPASPLGKLLDGWAKGAAEANDALTSLTKRTNRVQSANDLTLLRSQPPATASACSSPGQLRRVSFSTELTDSRRHNRSPAAPRTSRPRRMPSRLPDPEALHVQVANAIKTAAARALVPVPDGQHGEAL
jgi:hypothetical protein